MAEPKRKPLVNVEYDFSDCRTEDGRAKSEFVATLSVLCDIRAELRKLNKTLSEASIFVNGKVD